jgi:hypothetical protein
MTSLLRTKTHLSIITSRQEQEAWDFNPGIRVMGLRTFLSFLLLLQGVGAFLSGEQRSVLV